MYYIYICVYIYIYTYMSHERGAWTAARRSATRASPTGRATQHQQQPVIHV